MRLPRLDEPGTWHHVTNRGRNRQNVYWDVDDYESFLEHLGVASLRFDVEVHAYALMPNHYHLLVRSMQGRLSEGMQYLGSRYTQHFHLRHGTDGALFKGRFFSKLVDTERYVLEAARYIVNNPVKAKLVSNPRDYQWSSHAATMRTVERPDWLSDWLVSEFFNNNPQAFDRFVGRPTSTAGQFYAHVIDDQTGEQSVSQSRLATKQALIKLEEFLSASAPHESGRRRLLEQLCAELESSHFDIADPRTDRSKLLRWVFVCLLREQALATTAQLATVLGVSQSHIRSGRIRVEQATGADEEFGASVARLRLQALAA